MTLHIKTKRDINGNTYFLNIDLDKKIIKNGYNRRPFGPDDIEIVTGKRDLHKIQDQFEKAGYITEYI